MSTLASRFRFGLRPGKREYDFSQKLPQSIVDSLPHIGDSHDLVLDKPQDDLN